MIFLDPIYFVVKPDYGDGEGVWAQVEGAVHTNQLTPPSLPPSPPPLLHQVIFLDPMYLVKVGLWGMGKVFGPKWKGHFRVGSREGWPEGVDDEDVRRYVQVTKEEHGIGWEKDGSLKFDMEGYIERRGREEAREEEREMEGRRKAESLSAQEEQEVANAAAESVSAVQQMDTGGTMALGMS